MEWRDERKTNKKERETKGPLKSESQYHQFQLQREHGWSRSMLSMCCNTCRPVRLAQSVCRCDPGVTRVTGGSRSGRTHRRRRRSTRRDSARAPARQTNWNKWFAMVPRRAEGHPEKGAMP